MRVLSRLRNTHTQKKEVLSLLLSLWHEKEIKYFTRTNCTDTQVKKVFQDAQHTDLK